MLKRLSIFEQIVKDTGDVSFLQSCIMWIVKEHKSSNTRIIFNEYICLNDLNDINKFMTKFNRHEEKTKILTAVS